MGSEEEDESEEPLEGFEEGSSGTAAMQHGAQDAVAVAPDIASDTAVDPRSVPSGHLDTASETAVEPRSV